MKKDKVWLRKEFDSLFNGKSILTVGKSVVDEILDQLDEPEVLSQEWVNDNSVYASSDGVTEEYVHVDDLKELLVPKQEDMFNGEKPDEGEVYFAIGLGGAVEINVARSIDEAIEILTKHGANCTISKKPVIPKFVAKAIEEDKELGCDVYDSIYFIIETNGGGLPSLSDWVAVNIDKYAQAWLNGFTVEKHPMLLAKVKGWEQYVDFVGVIYWGIDADTDRLTFADRDQALAVTKKEWEQLGISEKNADFVNQHE